MRLSFDANFLDKFDDAPDSDRSRILSGVKAGALEFFATEELLREIMGIAKDPATHPKLVRFGRDVLDLVQGKVLARHLDIMESELRGKAEIMMEEAGRKQILAFLEQLAGGHVPSVAPKIGQDAIDAKKQAKIDYNVMYAALDARFGSLSDANRAKVTYNDVQEGWWNKTAPATIRRFCGDWGVPDPDKVADRVMADPSRYPHVRTWARIFALNMHRYYVVRSSRDRGDLFDLWQMTYLVDMDGFLTNEEKLPEWYRDVYGANRRVMTWEEFIAEK